MLHVFFQTYVFQHDFNVLFLIFERIGIVDRPFIARRLLPVKYWLVFLQTLQRGSESRTVEIYSSEQLFFQLCSKTDPNCNRVPFAVLDIT